MSIKLMSAAWDLDIPATEKMVLLCLCDYANAEGTCWPGAEGIGKRCSLTERTVRKAIKWLMDEGLLGAQIRPGKTAVYKIDPGSKFTPEANSPRNMTARPRKEIPDTPEAASDEPSRTIIEPPITANAVKRARDDFPMIAFTDSGTWRDFLKNRKAKRLPNTATAHAKLVADLETWATRTGWPPGEVFAACVAKGWGAIYDPRDDDGKLSQHNYPAAKRQSSGGGIAAALDRRIGLGEPAREARRRDIGEGAEYRSGPFAIAGPGR